MFSFLRLSGYLWGHCRPTWRWSESSFVGRPKSYHVGTAWDPGQTLHFKVKGTKAQRRDLLRSQSHRIEVEQGSELRSVCCQSSHTFYYSPVFRSLQASVLCIIALEALLKLRGATLKTICIFRKNALSHLNPWQPCGLQRHLAQKLSLPVSLAPLSTSVCFLTFICCMALTISWCLYFLTVWFRASGFNSLNLSSLLCKMYITMEVIQMIKGNNTSRGPTFISVL